MRINLSILFFMIFLSTNSLLGQSMRGVYTIGDSTSNFLTFQKATNELELKGVDSAVVFLIKSGVYDENITINGIQGTSKLNTISFKSELEDSSTVLVRYKELDVLYSDYIIFSDLTILSGTICADLKGCKNITFTNCEFQYPERGWGNKDENLISLVQCENTTVINSKFTGGGYGIYIEESSNTLIKNNSFHGKTGARIFSDDSDSIIVESNVMFENLNRLMMFFTYSSNIFINKNKFFGDAEYIVSTNNSAFHFTNNFISGADRAFLLSSSAQGYIYHNSISTEDLYLLCASCRFVSTKNNIVATKGTLFAHYNSISPTKIKSNYNAYYNTDKSGFEINGSTYSLSDIQNTYSLDLNSVSSSPNFVNDSDLHVTYDPVIDGKGLFLQEVRFDIDGEIRDTINPDIGADEFEVDSADYNDLEITNIISPINIACIKQDSIVLNIKNKSKNPVADIKITWGMKNQLKDTLINIMLPGYKDTNLYIGSIDFNPNTIYLLSFEINLPDSIKDNDLTNNSIFIDYSYLGEVAIKVASSDFCNDSKQIFVPFFSNVTYKWDTGDEAHLITPFTNGDYTVTLTNNHGCSYTTKINYNEN